ALVAAVFWGLYVLSSARVGQLVPGQDGLAVAMAIGALAILPLGAQGAVAGVMDLRLLGLPVATAVLASVLPYTLELSALRRLPRHVFGIMLSLEPVVALLAGVVLLSQEATAARIAAAVLVVAASAGVTLTARSGGPDAPPPGDEDPGRDPPRPTTRSPARCRCSPRRSCGPPRARRPRSRRSAPAATRPRTADRHGVRSAGVRHPSPRGAPGPVPGPGLGAGRWGRAQSRARW